jgi:hypothetical protein
MGKWVEVDVGHFEVSKQRAREEKRGIVVFDWTERTGTEWSQSGDEMKRMCYRTLVRRDR